MKVATIEDKQYILDLGMEFFNSIDYGRYASEEYVSVFLDGFLSSPKDICIAVYEPKKGMILGQASAFPFGPHVLASEIAWYVSPDSRKSSLGKELIDAFEYWAKNIAGCTMITLSGLDDSIGKFYEKQGYKLYEYAYMKEL